MRPTAGATCDGVVRPGGLMLLLSELLGAQVRSSNGTVVGRLVDVVVELSGDQPSLRRIAVRRRRRVDRLVPWRRVATFEPGAVRLQDDVNDDESDSELESTELLLGRDVLDTQVIDVAGKRLARVADVILAATGDEVRVIAVDVSPAGVLRRLGMGRAVASATERDIAWSDLHLTSERGNGLQLSMPDAAVHRLGADELAAAVAHLPPAKGARVLDAVAPALATHIRERLPAEHHHRLHAVRPFARVRRRQHRR